MSLRTVVILAAGSGSRIKPLGEIRSKAMMPIIGKPMIARVIETFILNEMKDFIIVVNREDRYLPEFFTHNNFTGVNIDFVYQDTPLGTAYALKIASTKVRDDFIVTACDNLVPAKHIHELINIWECEQPLNGILSLIKSKQNDISNSAMVEIEDGVVRRIIEKPSPNLVHSCISSIPLYCFSTRIFKYLDQVHLSDRNEYEIQDAIQMMITEKGLIRGIFVDHRLTLTNPKDLYRINMWFIKQNKELNNIPDKVDNSAIIIPPVYIESGSPIGYRCLIGPNVFIESGCVIENNVKLNNSVVLRGSIVKQTSNIQHQLITPNGLFFQ